MCEPSTSGHSKLRELNLAWSNVSRLRLALSLPKLKKLKFLYVSASMAADEASRELDAFVQVCRERDVLTDVHWE